MKRQHWDRDSGEMEGSKEEKVVNAKSFTYEICDLVQVV